MKQNTKGAIFMIICMLAYSINDALIKLAGINLPIFEAIFIRGIKIANERGDLQTAKEMSVFLKRINPDSLDGDSICSC